MGIFQRKKAGKQRRRPIFLEFRSSKYYLAAVCGMGLMTDLCLLAIYNPAIPFRLEALGYDNISSLTGWLSAAYAAGLIIATLPFSWLGGRVRSKRILLLFALLLMAVAIIIFLVVDTYAAMVVSRLLQGCSGAGVWTLGLALIADNVDAKILGRIMGLAMIGYSLGTTIGQPIGGILYAQLGWAAPSIFALVLVGIDFFLRLIVLENHEVEHWRKQDISLAQLAPAAPIPAHLHADVEQDIMPAASARSDPSMSGQPEQASEKPDENGEKALDEQEALPNYDILRAVTYLLFKIRPLTGLLISFTNGFLTSGIYSTALVLRLNELYGLDSMGAGLVYFAVAIPAAIVSPLSGHLTDKLGPRPLSMTCCLGFLPGLCLLMIDQLPLPAFIVLLCVCGLCNGLINSPVMVFLARVVTESDGRIGTSHAYGGFNIFFSFGAFIGPIAAGQVLEAAGISKGWKIMLGLTAGLALVMVPLAYFNMKIEPTMESEATSELTTVPVH